MLSHKEIILRLILAAILGAIVGLERERKNWTAGMRTHMMVCLGSSLMMMVSSFGFADVLNTDHVTLDPSRIAAQVVSGIGFLGAGTIILLRQGIVRGLTTASGLWTVAGVGLACGGGMYFAASITTAFALVILWALQPIEKRLVQRYTQRTLKLTFQDTVNPMQLLDEWFDMEEIKLANFSYHKASNETIVELKFDGKGADNIMKALETIKDHSAIKDISWSK
ncbi:MAG TPA: MgtC/SapB family protein [Pseudosphingobacterium sp.]|nr:MgtC/SapB family protein [Pseudosphingobacterium sp.]